MTGCGVPVSFLALPHDIVTLRQRLGEGVGVYSQADFTIALARVEWMTVTDPDPEPEPEETKGENDCNT